MAAKIANLDEGPAGAEIATSVTLDHQKSGQSKLVQLEGEIARQAKQALARHIKQDEDLPLRIGGVSGEETLLLPYTAATLLLEILKHMTKGLEVVVTPLQPELTTRQAAEILMVSRPHLVKLLDAGEIPCRWVGRHRRILRDDVMAYSEKLGRQRDAFLDRLVTESQELDLYD